MFLHAGFASYLEGMHLYFQWPLFLARAARAIHQLKFASSHLEVHSLFVTFHDAECCVLKGKMLLINKFEKFHEMSLRDCKRTLA